MHIQHNEKSSNIWKIELNSRMFGVISCSYESLMIFPQGLIGFENNTRFIVIDKPEYQPFKWLHSVDDPFLIFPIIEPQLFIPDYKVNLEGNGLLSIGLSSIEQAQIFTIVTIGDDITDVTANLRGPVIVNKVNRLGRQFILSDSSYSLRHRILTV